MDQKKITKGLLGLSSLVLAFLLGAHVRGCGSSVAIAPTPLPEIASPSPKVCPFPHGTTKVVTVVKRVPEYRIITEVVEIEKVTMKESEPKIVTVVLKPKRSRNRISVYGGGGQTGFDKSLSGLTVSIESKLSPIGGLGYQYALTDHVNLGVVGFSHGTFGASVGFDF